jgi:CheY-like chemotaxis protein
MTSNVFRLPAGPHHRALIAHQRSDVRHVLRTLIETENVAIVEAADGDAALAQLERAQFDLLVLELDLPIKDGLALMQLHRMLLAHERHPIEPPAVVFTLKREVRDNAALTDHLRGLGAAGFIDDAPRADAARLVEDLLAERASRLGSGKPAAA